jgi:hypothetical protein
MSLESIMQAQELQLSPDLQGHAFLRTARSAITRACFMATILALATICVLFV